MLWVLIRMAILMSTTTYVFMENWWKLSLNYHEIPSLSVPLNMRKEKSMKGSKIQITKKKESIFFSFVSTGHLSLRMQIPGNMWVEVWQTARPVPARRQKRLFDDTKEAEKVSPWKNCLCLGPFCKNTRVLFTNSGPLARIYKHVYLKEEKAKNRDKQTSVNDIITARN